MDLADAAASILASDTVRVMKNLGKSWLFLASAILFAAAPRASADLITNGNFATVSPTLAANGICASVTGFPYSLCSASGWTGAYQIGNGVTSGIGGATFNIPQPDPGGGNALILQETPATATATQSIDVITAGVYTLSFYAANRYSPEYPSTVGPQTLVVSEDGVDIAGGTYKTLPTSWTLETLTIAETAGIHTLTFEGLGNGSADVTAFVDDVSLVPQTMSSAVPEPSGFLLMLLALGVCCAARARMGKVTLSGIV